MVKWILIEILAEPAASSRGRHNPRVVKRKMSNFPTKSRSTARAARSRSLRYDEHIVIVAPPEPIAPTTMAGRQRAVPTTRQTEPAQTSRQTFWQAHVQAWQASGLPRPSTANSRTCHHEPSTRPSPACARSSVLTRNQPPIQLKSTVLVLNRVQFESRRNWPADWQAAGLDGSPWGRHMGV